ncbi:MULTISPECIES: lysine--tRNA ligase [unclassified Campylobacter]|uniref:lysine--tRNA ligase n=1 Tax=unclassified Campylobacter TaxID=2593542 RepID=UPI001BD9F0F2|nr:MULTISPECIES: lysine--tRNA ligase [unclassified Campylobacter]MBZ7977986.1 lysine--tRNA ligase [Campylobacter sp. RM12654]MBZ7981506.1 lysine--tRNA ligase [Campylobacter sp. RM12640]MBZ7989069.1 lysine--tRNA ligase [Campylobacter sp. RM12635]MBZ7990636.1 lysine--tRNA ligase [Campylobacter sp. RM9331]MBZ8004725.1 lysine--tRNA ligase [Campylobacter sp. RM9332]MBZ8007158.1 lysine--tRNA ligase [Campylobacter sp. RM9334]
MFENPLEQQKISKANELRSLGINPYSHFVTKPMSIKEFKDKYDFINELEEKKAEEICELIGRIKFMRDGGKAVFANIEDFSGSIQIYFNKSTIDETWFDNIKKLIEVGDIIKVRGYAFVTKKGEFSIHVDKLDLVTKSICVLPEKFHGLVDMESRYRQRYLDMIMNAEIRQDFVNRSKIVSFVRRYFENLGFLEVETPMMHEIAGGANARPFITHHNTLGVDRFLRIAPELYLKRLIVGGFEAVFELNRCFRNEGMDLTHNPEFSTIEFYWAYHNYKDLMNLTEDLLSKLIAHLGLSTTITYDDKQIDFSTPFAKIPYKDALVQIGGIDAAIVNDKAAILKKLKADGFEANEKLDLGHLQAELFDNYVEDKLINPTFITDFPVSISPLSRRSDENPEIAERFELFIAGKELANGFNELNDPLDQYERFLAQVEAKKAGNDEACEMDEDFVNALGFGMAPTAGEGIGIDRLVMMLTNKKSIKDVILFPAMRPKKD